MVRRQDLSLLILKASLPLIPRSTTPRSGSELSLSEQAALPAAINFDGVVATSDTRTSDDDAQIGTADATFMLARMLDYTCDQTRRLLDLFRLDVRAVKIV